MKTLIDNKKHENNAADNRVHKANWADRNTAQKNRNKMETNMTELKTKGMTTRWKRNPQESNKKKLKPKQTD